MPTRVFQVAAPQGWWRSLAREKRIIILFWSDSTLQTGDNMTAGWRAAYVPDRTQGTTPCSELSAIFLHCSGRFLNKAVAHVFGRKGVSISKKRKFLISWGLKLTTHSVLPQVSDPQRQKRWREDKCWTLPSTLSGRRADLWLVCRGLGRSVLTGLATVLTCCFFHWFNTVKALIPNLYRLLTMYVPGTLLSASHVLTYLFLTQP